MEVSKTNSVAITDEESQVFGYAGSKVKALHDYKLNIYAGNTLIINHSCCISVIIMGKNIKQNQKMAVFRIC